MNTFENYINEQYSLSIEDMQRCHSLLIAEMQNDVDANELYEDLVENATRYVNYRANWQLWNKDKQMNEDKSRSMCHDALITKFDILARYLRSIGYSTEWRDMLGDVGREPAFRKRIGDFACYLVFINSLNAR